MVVAEDGRFCAGAGDIRALRTPRADDRGVGRRERERRADEPGELVDCGRPLLHSTDLLLEVRHGLLHETRHLLELLVQLPAQQLTGASLVFGRQAASLESLEALQSADATALSSARHLFDAIDADESGVLSREELLASPVSRNAQIEKTMNMASTASDASSAHRAGVFAKYLSKD